MKEPVIIAISKLEGNKGQIPGLPENPRLWDTADVERLAKSLQETELLAESRPMLVYPYGNKHIVLGGNLRLQAYKKNGTKEAPCIVMDDVPLVRLNEIVMKDNSSFGEWDADELANKWSDLPLSDWGIDVSGLNEGAVYEGSNNEIEIGEWKEDMTLKLRFTFEQMEWIKTTFAGKDLRVELLKRLGYEGKI